MISSKFLSYTFAMWGLFRNLWLWNNGVKLSYFVYVATRPSCRNSVLTSIPSLGHFLSVTKMRSYWFYFCISDIYCYNHRSENEMTGSLVQLLINETEKFGDHLWVVACIPSCNIVFCVHVFCIHATLHTSTTNAGLLPHPLLGWSNPLCTYLLLLRNKDFNVRYVLY